MPVARAYVQKQVSGRPQMSWDSGMMSEKDSETTKGLRCWKDHVKIWERPRIPQTKWNKTWQIRTLIFDSKGEVDQLNGASRLREG